MNPNYEHRRPSDEEAIEATAAAWLAEQDSDGLSPSQSAEFRLWRLRDPRHEAAVQRLERTWSKLQQLREFRPEAVRHPDRDLLKRPPPPRRRVPFPSFAAAAMAAALVGLAVLSPAIRESVGMRPTQRCLTHANGYERVTLEDGSMLELNAHSDASIRFTRSERRVELVQGEAHFTVAKDPARPFVVQAGAVSVTAVGTAFNVKRTAEKIEVLVTEGRVAVGPGPGGAPIAAASRPTHMSVGAYERVVVPDRVQPVTAPSVERVAVATVQEALGWQKPRLVFVDTPLAEVVAQFNRQSTVEIVVADPELAQLPVGGSMRAADVGAFLRLIETSGDVLVDRSETGRILLRRTK